MTAAIRVFVALFITMVLAGAAGANDDLPPQGGPLGEVRKVQPPQPERQYYPSLTKAEKERIRLASPITTRFELDASGRLEHVTVVKGPKDPEFQKLMKRVLEADLAAGRLGRGGSMHLQIP